MKDIILGIDVDGTLAQSINSNLSTSMKQKMIKIYNQINFGEKYGIKIDVLRKLMVLYFNIKWKNWKNLKPIDPDISQIIKKLSEKFYIRIITSSPGNIENVKNWLLYNKIYYDEFIKTESGNKYNYCDILIDDRVEVVETMNSPDKLGILFDSSESANLNEGISVIVCKSWKEIYEILVKI